MDSLLVGGIKHLVETFAIDGRGMPLLRYGLFQVR
jgi:hypothetical protein